MITYQPESVHDVREEIQPLLERHYLEITTNKAVKPLDVNWDAYRRIEDESMLRVFTARDQADGRLIGYLVTFVNPHLHYQQTMSAVVDVYYVAPEHRNSIVGYNLLKHGIEDLKNLGADILTMHMKTDYPFRNLLIRQGFSLTEENWEKVL